MEKLEVYQAPRSNFETKEFTSDVVEPCCYVTRKAPAGLQNHCPDLWKRVVPLRYAFLQTPWTIVLFILFLLLLWPLALPFLGLTLWQKNYPNFKICKIIESFVFVLFAVAMFLFSGLVGLFITGGAFLIYEKSARSWHYLFNYMCLTSDEFKEIAKSKEWVKPVDLQVCVPTGRKLALTAFVLFFGIFILLFTL